MGFLDKLLGRTKDVAGDVVDKTGDIAEKGVDVAGDVVEKGVDVAGDAVDKGKDLLDRDKEPEASPEPPAGAPPA